MNIDSLAQDTGPSVQFTMAFRSVLEDHMSFFRNHPDTILITVEPHDAAKWGSDLFGYLTLIKVPVRHHWVIMRINSMFSPTDFGENCISLLLPSFNEIDKIQRIHQIKSKTTM